MVYASYLQAFKTALPELPLSSFSDSHGEQSCPWNSTTQLSGDFCFLMDMLQLGTLTVTNSSKKVQSSLLCCTLYYKSPVAFPRHAEIQTNLHFGSTCSSYELTLRF